jgi:hypothetical protein
VLGTAQSLRTILLLLALSSLPGPAFAEGPNQAALVVQFGDGRIETRCVSFEGEAITGADLLTRSGLDLVVDASSGMGIIICRIEGEGCAYPAEPCFCQCMGGGACAYWNYFYRDPGATAWAYSPQGAILRRVKPGSVEGWVWGDGHTAPGDGLTFEAICVPPSPQPSSAPPSPLPLPATVTPVSSKMPLPIPSPTTLPTATAPAPSPMPSPAPQAQPNPAGYWVFGLTVIVLAAIGIAVWLRRR